MKRTALLFLATCAVLPLTAQYQGPESVEYDAVGDRYFVSNTASNSIKVRDQAGNVTDFVPVSPAPYGLEIKGDTLFACSGGGVKGYLLSTGTQVFNLSLGATFLNGITTDGHYLYVTDFNVGRIYQVEPTTGSFSTWVANTGGTPNGIVYAPGSDQLLVAYWGPNANVRGYDRATQVITGTVSTGLTNIDGITLDCQGRVLISSWSPDRISRFEWGIMSPTFEDLMVPGLNNPADIDYDDVNDKVCIPNAGNNTVQLFELGCIPTGLWERSQTPLVAFPDPVVDEVRFLGLTTGTYRYQVIGPDGRIHLTGSGFRSGDPLHLARLTPGRYIVLLIGQDGARMRTVLQKT